MIFNIKIIKKPNLEFCHSNKIHRPTLLYTYLEEFLNSQTANKFKIIQKVTEIEYYVAFCTLKIKYFYTLNTNMPI